MTFKKTICALCVGVVLSACGIGGLSLGLFPGGVSWSQPWLTYWEREETTPEQRRVDCEDCGADCNIRRRNNSHPIHNCWANNGGDPYDCDDWLDLGPKFTKSEILAEANPDEYLILNLQTTGTNPAKVKAEGQIKIRLDRKWSQCMWDKGYRELKTLCKKPDDCVPNPNFSAKRPE